MVEARKAGSVTPFHLWLAVVLFRLIRLTDDGNRQEDKDPNFVDVSEGDHDEGKS